MKFISDYTKQRRERQHIKQLLREDERYLF